MAALTHAYSDTASPLVIITGHYGVGKTNLSLNLVKRWIRPGIALTLVDLDIVNPYFRASDSQRWLADNSVRLLGPLMAGSSLDLPSLMPGIDDAIREASPSRPVVIDVGGDPDGARALARYAPVIAGRPYQLAYVANFKRPEVATAQQSLTLMRAIEWQSSLQATAIIGNSHLKQLSSVADIIDTVPALLELSRLSGLPVAAVTVPAALADDFTLELERFLEQQADGGSAPKTESLAVLPIDTMVKSSWE